MTVLPIVGRELRLAARRRSTYWVRIGTATVTLLLGIWFFLMMGPSAPRELATSLFSLTTAMVVLYALFCGISATADCLSSEKREGTLGLLFLTDLKGYDVVLGKLVASSVSSFYGVLAVLPLLSVPLLMGGITGAEVWRMVIVAVNTLFFSLCAGMVVSAMSRDGRKAMIWTFLLLLLFTGMLPAIAAWLASAGKLPGLRQWLFRPSPGYSYVLAFDRLRIVPGEFWWSIGCINALSWCFLAVASLVAPLSWQDRPAGSSRGSGARSWIARLKYGGEQFRTNLRRTLLQVNAFYWLASRPRLKPLIPWLVLLVLAGLWLWGLIEVGSDWLNSGMYVTTAIILNVLIKGWVASESGRQLAEERQQGTLELLLSTPLKVRDIMAGQRLALQRQFLGPLVVVLALDLVMMAAGQAEISAGRERNWWTITWLLGMAILVVDLVAIHWVGMWQGLTARNFNRAAQGTIVRILVFPWVVFALIILMVSLSSMRGGDEIGWGFLLMLWLVLGIGTDLGFGIAAHNKLMDEFRTAAAQRFEAPKGIWRRLFG